MGDLQGDRIQAIHGNYRRFNYALIKNVAGQIFQAQDAANVLGPSTPTEPGQRWARPATLPMKLIAVCFLFRRVAGGRPTQSVRGKVSGK